MHITKLALQIAPPITSDYNFTAKARDAFKKRFSHLADASLSDDTIKAIFGLSGSFDLRETLKKDIDTRLDDLSPIEQLLVISLTSLKQQLELHPGDLSCDFITSAITCIFNDNLEDVDGIRLQLGNHFSGLADSSQCEIKQLVFDTLISLSWYELARHSNTLYSIVNPMMYCKEYLQRIHADFKSRSKELLGLTASSGKMKDLFHEACGSSSGAQGDIPYLISKKRTFSLHQKQITALENLLDKRWVNVPDGILEHLARIHEVVSSSQNVTLTKLFPDGIPAQWLEFNRAIAACELEQLTEEPIKSPTLRVSKSPHDMLNDVKFIAFSILGASQSKLAAPARRPDGIGTLTQSAIRAAQRKFDWEESFVSCVSEHFDPPMDGFELALILNRYERIDVSRDEASDLDEIDSHYMKMLSRAELIWASATNPIPEFEVGDRLKEGTITGLYEYEPARYLVKPDGQDDDSTGRRRQIIKFEDAIGDH